MYEKSIVVIVILLANQVHTNLQTIIDNPKGESKFLVFSSTTVTPSDSKVINPLDFFNNVPICVPSICPPKQGICVKNKCQCITGFITIHTVDDHRYCNYEQKSMKIAFLLEACGLIGFGHFYAGRLLYGLAKFSCIYFLIMIGIQFIIYFLAEVSETSAASFTKNAISLSCLVIPLIWHLIDLINFCNNKYLDGEGYPMLHW